eukprot:7909528-Heterocapsa_arctica.AAC.1
MLNNPRIWATAVKTAVDRTVDSRIAQPKFVDLGSDIPPPIGAFICELCPAAQARHCSSAGGLRQH